MTKLHKIFSSLVFILTAFAAYFLNARISEAVSQNLVTFFSVVFGFYMTSVAILYSASYTKKLFQELDPNNPNQRKIHKLRNYYLVSGYWSIFSIILIIIYTIKAQKDSEGLLIIGLLPKTILNTLINFDLLASSLIFAVSAVNVYFTILLLNTILDGMLEEARNI